MAAQPQPACARPPAPAAAPRRPQRTCGQDERDVAAGHERLAHQQAGLLNPGDDVCKSARGRGPSRRGRSERRLPVCCPVSSGTPQARRGSPAAPAAAAQHRDALGGAPAATAASRTMRAASIVQCLARGCGHSTSALRVLSASSALKMAVLVGLVVGTMPGRVGAGGGAGWRSVSQQPVATQAGTTTSCCRPLRACDHAHGLCHLGHAASSVDLDHACWERGQARRRVGAGNGLPTP